MRDFFWSIFGNSDDPLPLPFHWPGWPQWVRVITWYMRNPLHNLLTYRWGLKGKKYKQASLYGPNVWGPEGSMWNMGVTFYESKEYPFISRRGKYVEWYLGWRLPNGALGATIRRVRS